KTVPVTTVLSNSEELENFELNHEQDIGIINDAPDTAAAEACSPLSTNLSNHSNPPLPTFATTGILEDDEIEQIEAHQLEIEVNPPEESPIQGNRIVELGYVLQWAVGLQYNHSKICTHGKLNVAEELNRALWGTLATGSSYEHMKEFLSCMDIPPMNKSMFYDMEAELGKEWQLSLSKSMEAANIKEKEIAIQKKSNLFRWYSMDNSIR
ncbi:hypothetical protein NQ315_008811, partial [Exocentrus adspersus]